MKTIKANDTHAIGLKVNYDLTGVPVSDIRLLAKAQYHDIVDILDVEVIDAPEGLLSHQLTGTMNVGLYNLEVEVTKNDEIITFPNDGYAQLKVNKDLG